MTPHRIIMETPNMTTDCPRIADLSAYLDGELSAPARAALETHLHACATCDEHLAALTGLRRGVTALGRETVGFDLAPRLRHRLGAATAPAQPWWPRPWGWLPLSFAATATVVVGVFLGSLLVRTTGGALDASAPAMALFDPIPPGGICLSARPCHPQGKS